MRFNRGSFAAFLITVITFFQFMIATPGLAGVKTKWTIDTHNTDHSAESSPDSLLYSKKLTISILDNGAQVGIGGGYNPLSPIGPDAKPTGDFRFKLRWAKTGEAKYFLTVYDRSLAPPNGFNAKFETEGRMQPFETQRVYFTHGNFSTPKASRYVLFIRLDSSEPCDDKSTCFVE